MTASVLVVDDDPRFRVLARRLLSGNGLTVIGEADSIAAALSAAARTEPSAALVDVGLPDGSGFTLARQLVDLPWAPRVVMTSADEDVGTAEALERSGALAFFHKTDLPNAPLMELLGGA
jgi:DNA-binding NarL/FixJ family response regulator